MFTITIHQLHITNVGPKLFNIKKNQSANKNLVNINYFKAAVKNKKIQTLWIFCNLQNEAWNITTKKMFFF